MLSNINIDECVVLEGSAITLAVSVIDNNYARIAIVINNEGSVLGTITDGDVRRHIVNGGTLDDSVNKVMNRGFIYADEKMSLDECAVLMQKNNIRQISVLNQSGKLVKQYMEGNLFQYSDALDSTVVIMAGGQGKRLRPETLLSPKPLVTVNDVPLIEIIINNCKKNGFSKFIISVNYLKEQIIEYLGNGEKFGVSIEYVEEDKPLGTAGALSLISTKLTRPFLLLNADVLTKINFNQLMKYHDAQDCKVTMCVFQHNTKIPFGVVEIENGVLSEIKEKPEILSNVNAGIYVIDPSVLDYVEYNKYLDMPDLLNLMLLRQEEICIFPMHEYWLDVGQHSSLSKAHKEWA